MRVVVIGATGHVGRAVVSALSSDDVVGVGRHSTPSVDVTDPASIDRLFTELGAVDAVVTTLGTAPFRPLAELTRDDYLAALAGKVMTQLDVVRIATPYVSDGGSFTVTSGVLVREPVATGTASALANGALEAYVRSAAAELPRGLRINAVSPSVLEDAPSYHPVFPGFVPVSSHRVGQAYVKSVHGVQTGQVFAVD